MIKIIPAIDIIGGKCVRLSQGDYSKVKQYYDDPLDVALMFEDHAINRLHLVDLDGAKEKKIINYKTLEKLASKTRLHIDFGGGLQSDKDLQIAFECGAKQVTGGSIAVKNKEVFSEWLQKYGSEKIILGADTKDKKIAVHGWQETSEIHLFDLLEENIEKGIKYCISTDVAKDGMLQGPSTDLYKEMKERFPTLQIIASGGVSSLHDIDTLMELNIYGVIIGKAIYEGKIALKDLKRYEHPISNIS
jgi:phosphoribosylformimino-5-aminoimidazole carboxamide ribotide isomerase